MEPTVTTADWIETEVRPVMAMLGRKWAIAAVVALRDGPQRHRDLRRTMEGVSDKVLTATLRTLAASGIVRRELYPAVPPRVEYQLTPLGRSLDEALAVWVSTTMCRATRPVGRATG
jgi:DNA-binding HxlR family transcriptional regulator